MQALVQYVYCQINGFKFIKLLGQNFNNVELLEQVGYFFKIRVPREDKSIGYLFGMIQTNKEEMCIKEYGVQSTSLEQIFAGFALMEIDDNAAYFFKVDDDEIYLINPDRRSTVHQRRATAIGLKSHKALLN